MSADDLLGMDPIWMPIHGVGLLQARCRKAEAERDAAMQRAADTERRVVEEIAEWLEAHAAQNDGFELFMKQFLIRSIRVGAYRKQQESKTTQGARDV